MEIINECEELIKSLNTHKETIQHANKAPIFKNLHIRNKSFVEISKEEKESIANLIKPKKGHFRLSYIRCALPFLDLKTILNISLLNKEFYYLVNSIDCISNVTKHKRRSKTPTIKQSNLSSKDVSMNSSSSSGFKSKEQDGGVAGKYLKKITGAFSFLNFVGNSADKERKIHIDDPKPLFDKLDIYEELLTKKLKNVKLSQNIQVMRKEIDEIIMNRKSFSNTNTTATAIGGIGQTSLNNFKDNNRISLQMNNQSQNINEREFLIIKNDKYEYEYNEEAKEILLMREEVF